MAAGRPTDYSEQTLRDAWAYVQEFSNDVKTSSGLIVNLPTIEGLSLYLEISRSTLYLWQKEHKEFSDIIEVLQQKQAQVLINNGLSGNYNSTIAKVLLTKHGYTDKQEIDHTTKGESIKTEIDYSKLSEQTLLEIERASRKQG